MNKAAVIFASSLFIIYSHSYAGDPGATPSLPNIPREWTKIVSGPTHYMGRDLTPTCSGFPGTNPAFSFFVKGGNVNNLVVYFEGGGGCWSALTCLSRHKIYKTEITDTDDPVHLKGMFDLGNPKNPFKEWNFVFIPYCTGDGHRGSNDSVYEYEPGKTRTIHHRGHDNFLVVLKWITEKFEQPRKIFVTGSSAGSLGATGNFPWIKEAYPKSKVYVLGDAGMEITPMEYHGYKRKAWNSQLPKWIFGENPPFNMSTPEFWKALAEYYPHSKLAEFTCAWDIVQIYFYYVFLQTVRMPLSGKNVCIDWNAKMLAAVRDKEELPNYRSYIAAGTRHTIMATPEFYTESSAGVPFLDWLNMLMDDEEGTHGDGPGPWKNVKCIDCDAPAVCQY
jgi:hypothetical protein